MNETTLVKSIQLAISRSDARLFRNNVGQAWQGVVIHRTAQILTLAQPRPVHFGLSEGSADLIGFKSITITPDMVGRKVAVFASVEAKMKDKYPTAIQRRWGELIHESGGITGIARSVEEAQDIMT